MNYLFVIDATKTTPELAFIVVVVAGSDDEACQKAHTFLKAKNPTHWSDDWRDLKEDCENGNQTWYGPYTEVPVVS